MPTNEKTFIYEKNALVSLLGSLAFVAAAYLLIFGLIDVVEYLGYKKLVISGICFLVFVIASRDDQWYKLEKKGKYIYYTNLYEAAERREDREKYASGIPWLNKQMKANPKGKDKLLEGIFGTAMEERTLVSDVTDQNAIPEIAWFCFQKCVMFPGMRDGVEGDYIDRVLKFKARHRDRRTGMTLVKFLEEA